MNTFSHLWRYLTKFFLEWEMVSTKVVKKIKTHILWSITFFPESRRLWDNVEKCGGARGHKWRHNTGHTSCMLDKQGYMHACACTRPRARAHARTSARAHAHTHTHKYIIFIAFPLKQWFANAPQCYIIRIPFSFLPYVPSAPRISSSRP
jgi:hypothetical protein